MKTYLHIIAIFLLALPASGQSPDLKQLAWMAGTWAGTDQRMEMEEHWTTPKGNLMLGLHRDVVGDRTVSFEFLRIERTANGIAYIAQPQGRPPTSFPMIESAKSRVVFENKAHDFPQRITYWLDGDNLKARVEGEQKGRKESMEWSWRRVRE